MRGVYLFRSLLGAALMVTGLAVAPATAHARTGPAGGDRLPGAAVPAPASPPRYRRVCPQPPEPDRAACQAMVRTDLPRLRSLSPHANPPGYGPQDIGSAYDLPRRAGEGRTVAIVGAFDYPSAESDLAVYRAQFHLPPCTTAHGCFRKVNAAGPTPLPDSGWALESALDIQAVSAACPDCRILLVQAATSGLADLFDAVDVAHGLGAKFISMSWGVPEAPGETIFDHHFNFPGIAWVASSGDAGYPNLIYPAASPYVTAAGGTTLVRREHSHDWDDELHNKGRGWSESAWSNGGSGCSRFEPKPAFQHDPDCPRRTVADISALGDPATGFAVYDTFGSFGQGWQVLGGTSLSAPLVAAMYALAGNPAPGTYPNSYPYARPWAFNDITTGSNGSCGGSYLCTAVKGYDGPTGIGTPHGVTGLRSRTW
ncbi:S8 family serine peptidase [Streptomyces mirabilis]|uniref:S53 family peptidase n=1 Tax=Streptomyces mirabilis TaxID=68239 RepID=UPI0036B156AD